MKAFPSTFITTARLDAARWLMAAVLLSAAEVRAAALTNPHREQVRTILPVAIVLTT